MMNPLKIIIVTVLSVLFSFNANAKKVDVDGLIVKKSPYSVDRTIDRLDKILRIKGIRVVYRLSHSVSAKENNIPLRDTELLMFANPLLGSHLFTSQQSAGIDLPMKALAWKDKNGQVWLGYNDPYYIAKRHHIKDRDAILKKMFNALDKLTDLAIKH